MTKIKNILIIIPVLFILISCDSEPETGILYKWESESKSEWKTFGDLEFHQKYVGELSGNEPHGDGIMYYPNGRKIIGFWRRGKINYWTENGIQKAILYGFEDRGGDFVWRLEADDYLSKYEGDVNIEEELIPNYFKSRADKFLEFLGGTPKSNIIFVPHGFGTLISESERYEGKLKDGKRHGSGTLTILEDEFKVVGVWKDGKQNNTITYDKNNNILGKCDKKPMTAADMELPPDAVGTICDSLIIDLYLHKLEREKSSN